MALALVMLAALLSAGSALAEKAAAEFEDFAITLTADETEVTAGQKVQLTAEFANPETVNRQARNDQIVWTVTGEDGEKTRAAGVSAQGLVTTQRNVTVTTKITVTAAARSMPEQTASVTLTVIPLASKVTVETDAKILYPQEGYDTARLTALVEPEDAADEVTWKSSNEKVATVSKKGVVKAVSAGRVTVTATAADGSRRYGRVDLTVGVPVGRLGSMNVSGKPYLTAGRGGLTFSVREFLDARGNKVNPTDRSLTWSLTVYP